MNPISGPSAPVLVSMTVLERSETRLITRPADLDDATLDDLIRGMQERWRPHMKLSFGGMGAGLLVAAVGMWGWWSGLWPAWVMHMAVLPMFTLTPFIGWKQRQLREDEAERTGVSPTLIQQLWRQANLMAFRPRIMARQLRLVPKALVQADSWHELATQQLRQARDELAAREQRSLSGAEPPRLR